MDCVCAFPETWRNLHYNSPSPHSQLDWTGTQGPLLGCNRQANLGNCSIVYILLKISVPLLCGIRPESGVRGCISKVLQIDCNEQTSLPVPSPVSRRHRCVSCCGGRGEAAPWGGERGIRWIHLSAPRRELARDAPAPIDLGMELSFAGGLTRRTNFTRPVTESMFSRDGGVS
jgi:hypothetical protein